MFQLQSLDTRVFNGNVLLDQSWLPHEPVLRDVNVRYDAVLWSSVLHRWISRLGLA